MLLLTIVLLFQLSHFVDTNTSLPLVGNMSKLDVKRKNKEPDVNKLLILNPKSMASSHIYLCAFFFPHTQKTHH